jgi:hypothetical protein
MHVYVYIYIYIYIYIYVCFKGNRTNIHMGNMNVGAAGSCEHCGKSMNEELKQNLTG